MSAQTVHLSPEAKASLPRHVAMIMDGNGRWARQRHLPRIEGHRAGAESARVIIRTAGELGIKYLTLYAFSVENWNRPKDEVDALMKYLVHYLKSETPELNKNNVRLEIIGQVYRLPEMVQEHLQEVYRDALEEQRADADHGVELWRAHGNRGRSPQHRHQG